MVAPSDPDPLALLRKSVRVFAVTGSTLRAKEHSEERAPRISRFYRSRPFALTSDQMMAVSISIYIKLLCSDIDMNSRGHASKLCNSLFLRFISGNYCRVGL